MKNRQLIFHVVSSSGNGGYTISFKRTASSGSLSILCDCPAGIHGQLCKHKLALIGGDNSIYDPDLEAGGFDEDKWTQALEWIEDSGMYELVHDYQGRMKKMEAEKRRLQTQMKNEKARLARLLSEGVCK